MDHKKIRQGDEYFCSKCGRRWDVDEQEPPCEDISSKKDSK